MAELSARLREAGKGRAPLVAAGSGRSGCHCRMRSSGCGSSTSWKGRSTEYNMPQALRLRGELDLEALERTINTIVARHESLRTHFAEVDGEPVQVIEPALRIALPVEDLSGLDEEAQQEQCRRRCGEECEQPFDLARGRCCG